MRILLVEDRERQKGSGGAGLGLSIALRIAEAHHGCRLELRQPDERGSIFVAMLPMTPPLGNSPDSRALA
jgi:signal transduction histidine kinase